MNIFFARSLTAVLLMLVVTSTRGQQIFEDYIKQNDSLQIGNNPADYIPYFEKGYSLILPGKAQPLKGILISLEDGKFDLGKKTAQQLIHPAATENGYAVIYISTGVPIDLYFGRSSLQTVDSLLKKIFADHRLPNKNIFFFGAMTSGYRALKYIEFCKKGEDLFHPDIKGVIVSESAIDWVRMWYEAQKQVRDHLNDAQFFEGNLLSFLFRKNFHDTPQTNIEKYLDFSPYSYFDTKMRNIQYYKDIAVRAYTFAPVNYWFSATGKGVYDCNYPDMSGFINELKIAGNKQAELVVFSNETRAKTDRMEVQSNTWNLIDKTELMHWITKQIDH
jgi:hypothetical protein